MKIKSQDDILNEGTRKLIIEEILGSENKARKDEAYRRYLCYKDKTKDFVLSNLLCQFKPETVNEMKYAIANISIVRKVIDKLARVYSNGVKREVVGDEELTAQIEEISKELEVTKAFKKANRYVKLERNAMMYVKPCPEPDSEYWDLKVVPLLPFYYDVLNTEYEIEEPEVVILSNYEKTPTYLTPQVTQISNHSASLISSYSPSDKKDQLIADPDDRLNNMQFVWWSEKYHFTTNGKGQIISGENIMNDIQELPFANLALDQDGEFWATGGDDLVDGAILLNSMITNVNHVGITQGYGQFWMKGANLPRNVVIGTNNAILMEYKDGDPVPDLGFASANPQLAELRGCIEMYLALLMTTNNLSTNGIASQLNGSNNLASGIALVLDKAESMEDVQDQEDMFRCAEDEVWSIIFKYMDVYKQRNVLSPELAKYSIPSETEVVTSFGKSKPIMSESEHLDNLKKRQELGINTQIELIMMDDPSLTKDQAKTKLAEILAEKMNKIANSLVTQTNPMDNSVDKPVDNVDINNGET